jgi:hypothetical protein
MLRHLTPKTPFTWGPDSKNHLKELEDLIPNLHHKDRKRARIYSSKWGAGLPIVKKKKRRLKVKEEQVTEVIQLTAEFLIDRPTGSVLKRGEDGHRSEHPDWALKVPREWLYKEYW